MTISDIQRNIYLEQLLDFARSSMYGSCDNVLEEVREMAKLVATLDAVAAPNAHNRLIKALSWLKTHDNEAYININRLNEPDDCCPWEA